MWALGTKEVHSGVDRCLSRIMKFERDELLVLAEEAFSAAILTAFSSMPRTSKSELESHAE
jgi:hypothetical protein